MNFTLTTFYKNKGNIKYILKKKILPPIEIIEAFAPLDAEKRSDNKKKIISTYSRLIKQKRMENKNLDSDSIEIQ